jgi:hypothetical protein
MCFLVNPGSLYIFQWIEDSNHFILFWDPEILLYSCLNCSI